MTSVALALVLTAVVTADVLVTLCVASTTNCPRAESKPAGPLATGILEWLDKSELEKPRRGGSA
jgi:hypothetical protein